MFGGAELRCHHRFVGCEVSYLSLFLWPSGELVVLLGWRIWILIGNMLLEWLKASFWSLESSCCAAQMEDMNFDWNHVIKMVKGFILESSTMMQNFKKIVLMILGFTRIKLSYGGFKG